MCNSCKTACNCQDTPRTPVAGEVWVYKPDPLSTAIVKLVEGEDIYYKTSAGVRATSSISLFRLCYSPPKPKPREVWVNVDHIPAPYGNNPVAAYTMKPTNSYGKWKKFVEATE